MKNLHKESLLGAKNPRKTKSQLQNKRMWLETTQHIHTGDNMNKIFLCAVLLASSVSVYAQNNSQLLSEINQLTRAIRDEAPSSNASTETLRSVRNSLEDALLKLRQGGNDGGNKGECFNYAYEKYYISNPSSVATDKAVSLCRNVTDIPVLKFSYEKYYIANPATLAMDKAGAVASLQMRNKLDMLTYAYEKYYIANPATLAMDKAKAVSQLPTGSQNCLRMLYDRYYVSDPATLAMDKAIQGCK